MNPRLMIACAHAARAKLPTPHIEVPLVRCLPPPGTSGLAGRPVRHHPSPSHWLQGPPVRRLCCDKINCILFALSKTMHPCRVRQKDSRSALMSSKGIVRARIWPKYSYRTATLHARYRICSAVEVLHIEKPMPATFPPHQL